ncbi:MAG: YbaN family protein [Dethiobacter sp.]|jgi:uncharacterized membrane protein YbaN (DUF454 family)|nr:YbaN family protein [Dethiobacter sp.]
MPANKTKNFLLIIAGTLSLLLGIAGIFLPVVPTTPFLLLASACYLRSSKRLYAWLINHKILGSYIYDYLVHKAVKKRTRTGTLIFLWLTLLISIFVSSSVYLKVILVLVGVGVSIHLFTLKTLDQEPKSKNDL